MGGRVAVPLALALWTGMALGRAAGPGATWPALVSALLLLTLVQAASAFPRTRAVALTILFVALGAARLAASDERFATASALAPSGSAVVRLRAVVDEPPRREGDPPAATLRVLASEPPWPRAARLTLRLPSASLADQGDTLEVLARIDRLPGRRVPGGYDARASARAAERIASGRAFTVRLRPAGGAATLVMRALMRVRRAGERSLDRSLSPSARALAAPLLFGDRGGMDPDTDAMLRASGLVHLLALSGLHVAWLAGVARVLTAGLGVGLVARALAGAACALVYAGLAGPIPSLSRAVVSECATAAARASGRALDPLHSLSLSALVLLSARPAWAGDLGFQLSCAATLGLIAIGTPLSHVARRAPRGTRGLCALLAPTLGAQWVALPILIARFHALPWTSLIANLVAVPLAELLLAAAGLGAMLDALLAGAGQVWLAAVEPLAAALTALIGHLGGFPHALLPTGRSAAPVVLAAIAAAGAAWGATAPRAIDTRLQRSRVHAWAVASSMTCAVLALVLAFAGRPLAPPSGAWWCIALDVGQGDAIVIGTREGWWSIDCGPRSPRWDAGEGAVLPFLRWAGVRRLEAVALTHDDGDHTGGARAIARGFPVRSWWASAPQPPVEGPARRFHARTLVRGDTLALPPGGRVLWPPRAGEPGGALAARGDNAASLVVELGAGAARVLLTGDADSLVESALECRGGVALLKAGHHGSGSSSGAAFVRGLAPACVILSCGARNPYGHPERRALERLRLTEARIDRTDQEGTLWYECFAAGCVRLDWRSGQPWRARSASVPASAAAAAPRAF